MLKVQLQLLLQKLCSNTSKSFSTIWLKRAHTKFKSVFSWLYKSYTNRWLLADWHGLKIAVVLITVVVLWVQLRLFVITHLHFSSPLSSYEVIGCCVTQCLSVPVALWVCRHQPAAAASLHITVWMTKAAVEHWSLLMWRTSIRWDTQHAIHLQYTLTICNFFSFAVKLNNLSTYHCSKMMGCFFISKCRSLF